MLTEIDDDIFQERASALDELLRVVILQQFGKVEDFKKLYLKYGRANLTKEEFLTDCPDWVSRWMISQTFSAMALEAFYFDYIQNNASKTQAEKRRSPPERFEYICKGLLKLNIYQYLDVLNELKSLNQTRNHWTHNKSSDFDSYTKVKNFFSPDQCIQLLKSVFEIISIHDSKCIVAREDVSELSEVQNRVKSEINAL